MINTIQMMTREKIIFGDIFEAILHIYTFAYIKTIIFKSESAKIGPICHFTYFTSQIHSKKMALHTFRSIVGGDVAVSMSMESLSAFGSGTGAGTVSPVCGGRGTAGKTGGRTGRTGAHQSVAQKQLDRPPSLSLTPLKPVSCG